jgi:hypothetical protein
MKRRIGEEIFRETEGMTDEQLLKYFRDAVAKWDHPLAQEWRAQQMHAAAREDAEKYGE